jgi:hypothetical protein
MVEIGGLIDLKRVARLCSARADVLTAVALVGFALVVRRLALPRDGLFHDDAWEAVSITLTSPREWLWTSVEHPGFVAMLSPLRYIGRRTPVALVIPVLLAGALAPVAVFVLLRSLAYARSIATALATVLVVAPAPVVFSGHLKTYVVDIIIVAVVAIVLPRLAQLEWTNRVAVAWVVAALLLGTISGYALIVTAVAGVVLVWSAGGDRRTRMVAVALQLLVQGAYFLFISHTYSGSLLRRFWQQRNGFIELDRNPGVTAGNVFLHFRRVLTVFPGGGTALTTLLVIVVVIGLALAVRDRAAIAARFLVLLLLVAAVAGAVRLVPFGPGPGNFRGRLSLWLAPITAVGIAEVLHRVRALAGHDLRRAFDVVAYGIAIVLLVVSVGNVPRYAPTGSHSAVSFIDANLAENDVVILAAQSSYAWATETASHVSLRHDARGQMGTRLVLDQRVFPVDRTDLLPRLHELLQRARRAFVFDGVPRAFDAQNRAIPRELRAAGFVPVYPLRFGDTRVLIWGR